MCMCVCGLVIWWVWEGGGLEPNVGHGRVDLSTSLGAGVLGLAPLYAGVLGSGLDSLAVHKLGRVNH